MAAPTVERETWRIGDLVLDVGQQRVTRGDHEVPLPKLSFDLLLALARRAPNVLSLDEIMERVWPGLVVSPETIVQRVRLLRQALGEDAARPQYVEALRNRGYRLVPRPERIATSEPPAPDATSVDLAAEHRADAVSTEPAALHRPGRARTKRSALVAAVGLGVMATVAGYLGWRAVHRDAARTDGATAGAPATGGDAAARDAPTGDAAYRTVAVLPFESLSADPADAYLASGLPEVTLARLATVRGLTVIARESSLLVPGAGAATDTGQRLGARYLVRGSVQRTGDRLRVTARLVDARNQTQLWSRSWDDDLAGLYRLQDELADGVARTLEARIAGVELAKPRADYGGNVEATLAYLRGRVLLGRFTVGEAEAAAAEFERAIARDPRYAAALAALYDARMQAAQLRYEDLDATRARHRALLDRALELDPQSGSAHFTRAMWGGGAAADREADFRRGAELAPSDSRGLVAYAEFLNTAGRRDEARAVLASAAAVDPLSPRVNFRRAMWTLDESGADIERAMLQVLELDPTFYPALQRYSKYRWQFHGEMARPIALIERAIAADPQNPWGRYTAVAYYLDVGDPAAARDVAAATGPSARAARTLLALQAGDRAAAAAAALDGGARPFNRAESWGVPEALRDAALGGPADSPAERELRARHAGAAEGPAREFTYRARILLAHLALARGERAQATAALREALAWTEANARFGMRHRPRATAFMLLGETDVALRELATSFAEERDYRQWWYVLDHDPVWAPVRQDPRFRALADRVRAHVREERAALERMRAAAELPRRPSPQAPAATAKAATVRTTTGP
jgi:TolB-like protein/DNA-binding winged helix-turn-helix (wHTH) protein/Tfp pilus assembly protein PilF